MDLTIVINVLAIMTGLVLLWRAGDTTVHQIVRLTSAWNVSPFFFGVAVISVAGNVSELSVAVTAVFSGASQMAAGDLIGANFHDIILGFGIPLCFIGAQQGILSLRDRNRLLAILGLNAVVLMSIMTLGFLTRLVGLALVLVYVGALVWVWVRHRSFFVNDDEVFEHSTDDAPLSMSGLIIKFFVSFCLVVGASILVVQNALAFSTYTHIPQETIGALVLSIGTSLPELTLGIHSLRRGEFALVLSATLGAVLNQSTFILGSLAMLSQNVIDVRSLRLVTLATFVTFAILAFVIYQQRITRVAGFILALLFVGHMGYYMGVWNVLPACLCLHGN